MLFCFGVQWAQAQSTPKQNDILIIQNFVESLSGGRVKDSAGLAQVIDRECARHKMDPLLILSVISVESSFRQRVISNQGAVGLMQLLPSTGRQIATDLQWKNHTRRDLFDPLKNVKLGILYLTRLKKKFHGNRYHYLSAYYIGEGKVKELLKERPDELTYGYAKRVMKVWRALKKSEVQWATDPGMAEWD